MFLYEIKEKSGWEKDYGRRKIQDTVCLPVLFPGIRRFIQM